MIDLRQFSDYISGNHKLLKVVKVHKKGILQKILSSDDLNTVNNIIKKGDKNIPKEIIIEWYEKEIDQLKNKAKYFQEINSIQKEVQKNQRMLEIINTDIYRNKSELAKKIFSDKKISKLTEITICDIFDNKISFSDIKKIIQNYEHKKIASVKVPYILSKSQEKKLSEFLSKKFREKKLYLDIEIDEKIKAGFTAKFGDLQYNSSIVL